MLRFAAVFSALRLLRAAPLWLGAGILLLTPAAQAQLSIEVTGSGARQIPVAIADFSVLSGSAEQGAALADVARRDLEQSGLFRVVNAEGVRSDESSPVEYALWKERGADAFAGGSLSLASGRIEARFRLYDVTRQAPLTGAAFLTDVAHLRAAGHRVADTIYETLTGERGVFSTRIAYVLKTAGRYHLQIADADGHNAQTALISSEPVISPAWSPDGTRIAYVSFENKKPIIFSHSLLTGTRQVLANFKGSNSAPAWSPDGTRIALVLSRDGHSQIYLINANGGGLTRLSNSAGIDTEPQFSADDAFIYFTSDRGGSPQIYRVAAQGGMAERITFTGNYNVSPSLSPDGKNLAFITRQDGAFRLAVMDLASRQTQILSDSSKDESPSFAPNSRMIVLATEMGGRGTLSVVSIDGRVRQRLSVPAGDVREPAWSPFPR
ncbi:MAG: Tol-Pal system beta propeller repeat protein TolB [Zoogloeaceae bacterium]|jgi:TolB protein|nr:Tol-Pal system beta propeller repeat protein TolB [Zoogloeaceae bacterium]